MKLVKKLMVVGCVLFGVTAIFIGSAFLIFTRLTTGVWYRSVIRENPLKAPLRVSEVRGGKLRASYRQIDLAGLVFPEDPALMAATDAFLRVATAQGIELVRAVEDGKSYFVRAEPRFWHWCANDPIAASYAQINLNELLVGFGLARVADDITGLTEKELARLRAAENYAKAHRTTGIAFGARNGIADTAAASFDDAGLDHLVEVYSEHLN